MSKTKQERLAEALTALSEAQQEHQFLTMAMNLSRSTGELDTVTIAVRYQTRTASVARELDGRSFSDLLEMATRWAADRAAKAELDLFQAAMDYGRLCARPMLLSSAAGWPTPRREDHGGDKDDGQ